LTTSIVIARNPENSGDEAIFPQTSVIARNEVTKQSFLMYLSLRGVKRRSNLSSCTCHCEEWNDEAIFPMLYETV